jgi:peptidoglycan-N-acetylglucosamine deacetylase
LFGRVWEGFRPLGPYWWRVGGNRVLEIPVTTVPIVKAPMHVSYLMYLGQFSARLAIEYFRTALAMCRAAGIEPSLLLHPLDLLGLEDAPELAFFPAMHMPARRKLALVREVLGIFADRYRVVPLEEHARAAAVRLNGIR